MKKILVYGMTNKLGGIESYVMNMFRNIDKNSIQFDFVTDFDTMVFDDEVQSSGSLIHYIPSKSSDLKGHLSKLRKILKEHPEYEAVYFNILNAGAAITVAVVKFMKRKVIVHSHSSSDAHMMLHRVFRPLLKKMADIKFACSEIAGKYMFGNCKNFTVINNSVQAENFIFSPDKRQAKQLELGITENNFVVLHAGRMTTEKNPLFVIKVFSEILKKNPSAILLYAGTGSMEAEVKNSAKETGISNSVKFLGMRRDMDQLYQVADVFLLPSKYEGLPVSLIEAQAAGLPSYTSTAVTEEVAITQLLNRISLDQSAKEWAEIILMAGKVQRENMKELIEKAGYSINTEIKKLQDILQKI